MVNSSVILNGILDYSKFPSTIHAMSYLIPEVSSHRWVRITRPILSFLKSVIDEGASWTALKSWCKKQKGSRRSLWLARNCLAWLEEVGLAQYDKGKARWFAKKVARLRRVK